MYLTRFSLHRAEGVGHVDLVSVLAMDGLVGGLLDGGAALVLRVDNLGLVDGGLVGPAVVCVRLGAMCLALHLLCRGGGAAHVREGEAGRTSWGSEHAR